MVYTIAIKLSVQIPRKLTKLINVSFFGHIVSYRCELKYIL